MLSILGLPSRKLLSSSLLTVGINRSKRKKEEKRCELSHQLT